jgi:Protein of unknown function (DUF4197)
MFIRKHFLGARAALVIGLMTILAAGVAAPTYAATPSSGGIKSMLGNASDKALDKLATPGTFYADTAIRILLPGGKGKLVSKLLKTGDKFGVTTKLTKSLNDAAGLAALEAKPVFRKAVDGLTLADVPDLALKNDGATQYLKKSAGDDLRGKIRPLIVAALTKVGAYGQLSKLGSSSSSLLGLAGLSQDGLTDSVTDQTMSGIFSYIGKEEAGLRGNALGIGKSILDGIIKK